MCKVHNFFMSILPLSLGKAKSLAEGTLDTSMQVFTQEILVLSTHTLDRSAGACLPICVHLSKHSCEGINMHILYIRASTVKMWCIILATLWSNDHIVI